VPDSQEGPGEAASDGAVDDDTDAQPEPEQAPALGTGVDVEPAPAPEPSVGPVVLRHAAAVRLIRPNGAVILLGLLCALAILETIGAFLEYHERIDEDDWALVATVLAEHPSETPEPVIVASEWLGPSARMQLAQARSWDALAYPDLRSFPRFWVLSHKRERPWRGPLRAELEGSPRPQLLSVHDVGELTLQEYSQHVGIERFSLLESVRTIDTARGRCRGGPDLWSCKDGRVSLRTVEIDYRARRCLVLELGDGVTATVDLGKLEFGDHIRGHVGFADFNSRLRADPSARVELWIDGAAAARWVFTDDQGWAAFALATTPGRHSLELRASSTVAGTWQRDGHRDTPTDSLCIELRGFDERSPTP
jgi:hypothetical protein